MSNDQLSGVSEQPSGSSGSQSFRIKSVKSKTKIQKTRTVGGLPEDTKALVNSDAADSDASKNSVGADGKEWIKKLEADTISIIQPKYDWFLLVSRSLPSDVLHVALTSHNLERWAGAQYATVAMH